jgi:hypothetical protein
MYKNIYYTEKVISPSGNTKLKVFLSSSKFCCEHHQLLNHFFPFICSESVNLKTDSFSQNVGALHIAGTVHHKAIVALRSVLQATKRNPLFAEPLP